MNKSLIILVLSCALLSCSSEPEVAQSNSPDKAMVQGRADAETLIAAQFRTERELHSALLSVKSREWKLRQQGDTIGAQAYISAFRNYIFEHDAELAAKVF